MPPSSPDCAFLRGVHKSHPTNIPLGRTRQQGNELWAGASGSLLPVFGPRDVLNYSSHLPAADSASGMTSSLGLGPFARHRDPEPLHRLHTTVNALGPLHRMATTHDQITPSPVTVMSAATQALQKSGRYQVSLLPTR